MSKKSSFKYPFNINTIPIILKGFFSPPYWWGSCSELCVGLKFHCFKVGIDQKRRNTHTLLFTDWCVFVDYNGKLFMKMSSSIDLRCRKVLCPTELQQTHIEEYSGFASYLYVFKIECYIATYTYNHFVITDILFRTIKCANAQGRFIFIFPAAVALLLAANIIINNKY